MDYLEKLQEMASEIETREEYCEYFYKVADVVTILVVGLLCNLRTAHEIYQWSCSAVFEKVLVQHFGIEKMPCYAQFMNILGNVKAESLDRIFMKWCKILLKNHIQNKTIAIDGKTVRSTTHMRNCGSPLHIVSAYISEYGLTIGQLAVDAKSNEIPATQALIDMLDIRGAVVVTDALNCQRKTAKAVIDGGGDYLLAVKDNQRDLHDDLKFFFASESETLEKFRKIEKGHGRIETRTAWITHDVQWHENSGVWANLACFGAVRRVCEENGKISDETRYYIASRKFSAEEMLRYSRNEWEVESMRWQLDVIFNEDRTLLMEKNFQRTLNTLRKTALNLVRMYKTTVSPKSSLVSIMRGNLFNPQSIPMFFESLKSFAPN
ncbi:ISAs1 family transposase [Clostridia bacterium]|nr:ISAs1 family transposase [Clostridia bacterium]